MLTLRRRSVGCVEAPGVQHGMSPFSLPTRYSRGTFTLAKFAVPFPRESPGSSTHIPPLAPSRADASSGGLLAGLGKPWLFRHQGLHPHYNQGHGRHHLWANRNMFPQTWTPLTQRVLACTSNGVFISRLWHGSCGVVTATTKYRWRAISWRIIQHSTSPRRQLWPAVPPVERSFFFLSHAH
jgi:hypothetical protein